MTTLVGRLHKRLVNNQHIATMRLVGNDKSIRSYAHQFAQQFLIGFHDVRVIPGVGCTIEGAICTHATPAMTSGAECRYPIIGGWVDVKLLCVSHTETKMLKGAILRTFLA
jgi:hypothetical protein